MLRYLFSFSTRQHLFRFTGRERLIRTRLIRSST